MTASEQISKWLSTHDLISLNRLEKKHGLAQGCLYKAINNVILIPEKHIPVLAQELRPYGFKLKGRTAKVVESIANFDKALRSVK